jgi:hypothetical protein
MGRRFNLLSAVRRLRCPPCIALVLACVATWSAPGPARGDWDADYQQWGGLFVETDFGGRLPGWRASLDLQSRLANTPRPRIEGREAQNPNTILIVRPAVGYRLTDWAMVWAGYAWQPIYYRDFSLPDVQEHRAWEQFSGAWHLERWSLGTRTRLEHRYRSAGGPMQGEGEWAHRLRQQVRIGVTPARDLPWQLIMWDEIFFHLNTTGAPGMPRSGYPTQTGFDQNRFFVGLGYQPDATMRIELGYLNQIVNRMDRPPDQINHVLSFTLVFMWLADPGA